MSISDLGCGAPEQGAPLPAGVDIEKETVITGVVTAGNGDPIPGAYVRLLDASGEFTAEVPNRPATQYVAQPQDAAIRAFRDEVVNAIGTKNLVDVRSPDEYAGRLIAPAHLPQEQAQRAGHVPSALSVPWSKAANEDGTFKSDDELREIYKAAGLDEAKSTIAYCRIGERSSHTWFVLQELLGHARVKNYDGSWTEYGSLVGVPVAVGDEPGEG